MLPVEDGNAVFQEAYRRFVGGGALRCIGSEGIGYDRDLKTGERTQKPCPCEFLENKQCALTGAFHIMIPRVSLGGQFVIYTKSKRSSAMIRNTLKNLRAIYGKITGLQMTLNRVPVRIKYDKNKTRDTGYSTSYPGRAGRVSAPTPMEHGDDHLRSDVEECSAERTLDPALPVGDTTPRPMTDEQKKLLGKMMNDRGISTSEKKLAFFNHVLAGRDKSFEIGKEFIEHFDMKYQDWIRQEVNQ